LFGVAAVAKKNAVNKELKGVVQYSLADAANIFFLASFCCAWFVSLSSPKQTNTLFEILQTVSASPSVPLLSFMNISTF
jgi:hypothetical protein